ncbi:MAG: hypothetical protein NZ550_01260 [Fimbriimonadales bacterium]|nr:hypothetical protein [Fimbriimonadales bacterium]
MVRRESGRIWGVVVFVVLLAVIGAGAWYFFVYRKSPQYALNQFFAAAKANDRQRVEQYVDKTGAIVSMLTTAAAMNPNFAAADPVRAIYPGYGGTELGQTQKTQIESVSVEGDRAKVRVIMQVFVDGKTETIKPTYVMVKTDEGWKVHVQDTMFGSFNEFVRPKARQSLVRQLRSIANSPFGMMARQQLQMLRPEIERYPQFARLLKEAGLL